VYLLLGIVVFACLASGVGAEELKRKHLQLPYGGPSEKVFEALGIDPEEPVVVTDTGLYSYTATGWSLDDSLPVSITLTFFRDKLLSSRYSLWGHESPKLLKMFEREFEGTWYARKSEGIECANWSIKGSLNITCAQFFAEITSYPVEMEYATTKLQHKRAAFEQGGPADHRNMLWGMSVEEVKESETAELIEEASDYDQLRLAYAVDFGALKALLIYNFVEDRCVMAEYTWLAPPRDTATDSLTNLTPWEEVLSLYTDKYGEPEGEWRDDNGRLTNTSWSVGDTFITMNVALRIMNTQHRSKDFRFLIDNLPEPDRSMF